MCPRMPRKPMHSISLVCLMPIAGWLFPHASVYARMTRGEPLSVWCFQDCRLVNRLIVVATDEAAAIMAHPQDFAGIAVRTVLLDCVVALLGVAAPGMMRLLVL